MYHPITIREAVKRADVAAFWRQLRSYQTRDLFPDPADEDRAYFLGGEYRAQIERLHDRPHDRCRYLFFCRDGQDVGFALPVVYDTEDGKQFILEFCVFPEFRGHGTGRACAEALLGWGRANGAKYAELNANTDDRRRFWGRLGFVPNGCDEWGVPLMLLPPAEKLAFTVEHSSDPAELAGLENSFLSEIGEGPLDEMRQARLQKAAGAGEITFFVAKRRNRPIGMCSVSSCFSTFACKRSGVFDDFFVEPAFRHQGVARLLVQAAQSFCRAQDYASLTVGCADCDAPMYRALGFETRLGVMLASDF